MITVLGSDIMTSRVDPDIRRYHAIITDTDLRYIQYGAIITGIEITTHINIVTQITMEIMLNANAFTYAAKQFSNQPFFLLSILGIAVIKSLYKPLCSHVFLPQFIRSPFVIDLLFFFRHGFLQAKMVFLSINYLVITWEMLSVLVELSFLFPHY
ncbi:hypothetical protein B2K_38610 [Paenibacillus mucilaginosus K02]|uniref:Uncharacterized protein n=1 Tax=Paenibacillus mucilaginosus K02 TaxID=997761 RepID=I0BD61_9BACL|nr:hypothetical protein B2K_38610 [Paenibacillus mucilaginosus K02]